VTPITTYRAPLPEDLSTKRGSFDIYIKKKRYICWVLFLLALSVTGIHQKIEKE
jgi:hypothetical protein